MMPMRTARVTALVRDGDLSSVSNANCPVSAFPQTVTLNRSEEPALSAAEGIYPRQVMAGDGWCWHGGRFGGRPHSTSLWAVVMCRTSPSRMKAAISTGRVWTGTFYSRLFLRQGDGGGVMSGMTLGAGTVAAAAGVSSFVRTTDVGQQPGSAFPI